MPSDFVDEMIAKRTARNPDFPRLLAEARRKRLDKERTRHEPVNAVVPPHADAQTQATPPR